MVLNGSMDRGGSLRMGGAVVGDKTGVFVVGEKFCDVEVTSDVIDACRDCVFDEYDLLVQRMIRLL